MYNVDENLRMTEEVEKSEDKNFEGV